MKRARGKKTAVIFILVLTAIISINAAFTANFDIDIGVNICISPLSAIGAAPVILDKESKFAVGKDYIAYTCGGSLSIVDKSYDNSPITKDNAYQGRVMSIVMSSTHIALLTEYEGKREVTSFTYGIKGIGEAQDKAFGNLASDYLNSAGIKQLYYNDDTLYALTRYEVVKEDGTMTFTKKNEANSYIGTTDFALSEDKDVLYVTQGRYVKFDNGSDPMKPTVNYNHTPFQTETKGLFFVDGTMMVNTEDGIYYESENKSFKQIAGEKKDGEYAFDKGGQAEYGSNGYVYIFDEEHISIKRYKLEMGEEGYILKYNKSYDSNKYSHPTQYGVIGGAASDKEDGITLYRSPRDREIVKTGEKYVVALQDMEDGYYYCVTQGGEFGYAEKDAVKILNKSDIDYVYGQPLHSTIDTPIYAYPYKGAPIVANMRPDMSSGKVVCTTQSGDVFYGTALIMGDNVAEDNGQSIWNWYSVTVKSGEMEFTGYVNSMLVCPYTSYIPPSTNKFCRVNAKRAGVKIKMYSSPDSEGQELFALSDNTELMLADGYIENSEWTQVIYKGVRGYIKTENIIISGLTQLTVILIIVLCVLAAALTSISIILAIKRKRNRENESE